jgi:asparagine N-glycosylation enzyme membrane subunit Stt3
LGLKLNIALALIGIIALGIIARCLHMVPGDHYYILSTDSYYFHHLTERVIDGEDLPWFHQGLVYPLAWISKILPLSLACRTLPILLGILGVLGIYWSGSRIHSRRVGIASAFAWALLPHSICITAAGFVDRDGLSVLLITAGALGFWLFKDKHWVLAGMVAAIIGEVIVWEWVYIGRWVLLGSIAGGMLGVGMLRSWRNLPWKAFILLVVVSAFLSITREGDLAQQTSNTLNIASPWSDKSQGMAELHSIDLPALIAWWGLFMLPIVAGAIIAIKQRAEGPLFCVGWFAVAGLASILASRCLVFTIPPACMLAGLALATLAEGLQGKTFPLEAKRALLAILAACFIFLTGSSMIFSYKLGDFKGMAPGDDWTQALAYLRNETPSDAVVLNHWDYGYWIRDIGERAPVSQGGPANSEGIGGVYAEPDLILGAMDKHQADYFIFPRSEISLEEIDREDLKVAFTNEGVAIVGRCDE